MQSVWEEEWVFIWLMAASTEVVGSEGEEGMVLMARVRLRNSVSKSVSTASWRMAARGLGRVLLRAAREG